MNKVRYTLLAILFIFACILGFFLGTKSNSTSSYDVNEKIIIDAIRNSFDNINVRPNTGDITNIRLVCQNGLRYLYAFNYENYGDYEKYDNTNEFAIEMIIDKETEFYYVESLETYFNRYDNNCLNLFE